MDNSIFGDFITFEDKEKFNDFIENIDKTMALKLIEYSIEYGLKNGLYDLDESYCLYKCINKIKE